jgi:hypothetical protein
MHRYKGASNWHTISDYVTDTAQLDDKINAICRNIEANIDEYIDILDLSIRTVITPETEYDVKYETHYITMVYTIKEVKEKVVI